MRIVGLVSVVGALPLTGYYQVPSHIALSVVHKMAAVENSSMRTNCESEWTAWKFSALLYQLHLKASFVASRNVVLPLFG